MALPVLQQEMGAAVDATLGAADTVLFGRKTYDSFDACATRSTTFGGFRAHATDVPHDQMVARMGDPEMVEAMRYVQQTLVDALREPHERHD